MSHVDSGALHAYLDGALDEYPAAEARRIREHMDSCAECAARLEEERSVRQQADAILGMAVPHVEAPSFEELRAYVKATRPAPSPSSLRLYRLGWAASVVLAIGVGWMARGPDAERLLAPVPAAQDASAPDAAFEAEAAPAMPAETLAEEPTAVTAPSTEGLMQRAAGADAGDAPARERQVGVESTASRNAGLAEAIEADDVVPADASFADAEIVIDRTDSMAKAADQLSADLDVMAQADPTAGAGSAVAPAGPVAAPGAVGARALDEEVARRMEAATTREQEVAPEPVRDVSGRAAPPVVTTLFDVGEARRNAPEEVPVDLEEHAMEIDAVPGLEVVSFASLGEGTTPLGHHLVQRLPDGRLLDVYHVPSGVDPALVLPTGEALNEVRAELESGWRILRADATTDELRELLARYDSEG